MQTPATIRAWTVTHNARLALAALLTALLALLENCLGMITSLVETPVYRITNMVIPICSCVCLAILAVPAATNPASLTVHSVLPLALPS